MNFCYIAGLGKTSVGFVKAVDADEGINALVTYSIPSGLPFEIDNETGEVRTNRPLDYETQKVCTYFTVVKVSFVLLERL